MIAVETVRRLEDVPDRSLARLLEMFAELDAMERAAAVDR